MTTSLGLQATTLDFLTEAIARQRSSLRFHRLWASVVAALGLTIVLGAILLPPELAAGGLKGVIALGGTLAGSAAAFPLKEFSSRQDRIATLAFLRAEMERVHGSADPADAERLAWLQARVQQYVDKTLGG